MNQNNNNQQTNQQPAATPTPPVPQTPPPPVPAQSKSAKILQETAEAAAVIGVAAGIGTTLKGLFGKK
jgi:hypothetical protein